MSHPRLPMSRNQDLAPEAQVLMGWMQEIRDGLINVQLVNERNTHNERRLLESEERSADALRSLEQHLLRVHTRLDDVSKTVREDLSSVREEMLQLIELIRADSTRQISTAMEPVTKRLDIVELEAHTARSDLDAWLNRGKGAWFVASIGLGLLQAAIIAALVWAGGEIKALHDWRINVEAVERVKDQRNIVK